MKHFILLIIALAFFSSCKQIQYVPIETVHVVHDVKNSVDSVIINQHDTIWTTGDTVWKQKLLTKYIYRYRADTLYVHDTTAIAYEVKKIEYVEKSLSFIQKLLIWIGILSIAFIIIYIIIRIKF